MECEETKLILFYSAAKILMKQENKPAKDSLNLVKIHFFAELCAENRSCTRIKDSDFLGHS